MPGRDQPPARGRGRAFRAGLLLRGDIRVVGRRNHDPCCFAAAAAAEPDIVVTASLEPVARRGKPRFGRPSSTSKRIEALGAPLVSDLARLAPGVSVAVSGAQGSLTQIRIRGAEANHTLLFVDGIAFNDPASGNEARFENFAADGLARIEIVRGPQSALWGSEALGGVIALEAARSASGTRLRASGRIWQPRFQPRPCRPSPRAATRPGSPRASPGCKATESTFSAAEPATGTASATWPRASRPRPGWARTGRSALVGHYIRATSEFDGTPPPFFLRADTLDSSSAEIGAVARLGAARPRRRRALEPRAGRPISPQLQPQPRRRDAAQPHSGRPAADRRQARSGASHRRSRHMLIAAAEREDESFAALDQAVFFAPDQRRSRGRTALVGEWRARLGPLPCRPTSPSATTISTASRMRRPSAPAASPGPSRPLRRSCGLWRGHRPADLLRPLRLRPDQLRRQPRADPGKLAGL